MSTIVFRGAVLRNADLRKATKESAPFLRLHFSADLTKPVMEAMGWFDDDGEENGRKKKREVQVPDCVQSCDLDGVLSSRNLVLTPTQKELKDHEIDLQCSEVGDFKLVRVTEKDGESKRNEIRFSARVGQRGASQWVEEYLCTVGHAPAAMKVTYDEQVDLQLNEDEPRATKEQRAAVAKEND